jgi:hypothetical protein
MYNHKFSAEVMTSTEECRLKATIFQSFGSKRVNVRLNIIMPKCEFDLD